MASLTSLHAAVFDATAFGAAADGTRDSGLAIQAAIDAAARAGGGKVVLPASARPYVIRDTLRISGSGIELSGSGARILVASGALNGRSAPAILVQGTEAEPVRGVVLRGFSLDANFFEQTDAKGSKAIVFRLAEDILAEDVSITRAYVGLSFQRCTKAAAVRVTVTDYAEDAFDAGGEADAVSGGKSRHVRFTGVVARDAPRAARDGNAFEIEDGAENVLIEDALVENVAGNGAGLRNHASGRNVNHSARIALRNVTFRDTRGAFALFARCAPREQAGTNSYHDIRLENVSAGGLVAFWGPIRNLVLQGGDYSRIHLGLDGPLAMAAAALETAELTGVKAASVRINGASGRVSLSQVGVGSIETVAAR